MRFSTLLSLVGLAAATNVTVVKVSSSNNSLIFSPDNIQVDVGGMVQFQFLAGNHTVTQSTFDQPCQPIHEFNANVTGFHSGFVPVAAANGKTPTYTIQINNTTPIWAYCAQGKHCQAGMVMVINENTTANKTRSLSNFKSLAAKATTSVPSTNTTTGDSASTTSALSTMTTSSTSTSSVATGAATALAIPRAAIALAAAAVPFMLL